MKAYFGFVYIWFDSKRKKFCIGSHMGTFEDGYISSTGHMLRAYKKRPDTFKRRILFILYENNRELLLEEETRWLLMIKPEELNIKYYNLKRFGAGGNTIEGYTLEKLQIYKETLAKRNNRGKNHHSARAVICNGIHYETISEAYSAIGFDPIKRLCARSHADFYFVKDGPISEEERLSYIKKKQLNKEKTMAALLKSQIEMSELTKTNRGIKAAQTRKITNQNIGNKISESLKKRPGKRVIINGVIYPKIRVAAEELGIKLVTAKDRLKSSSPKYISWHYLDESAYS